MRVVPDPDGEENDLREIDDPQNAVLGFIVGIGHRNRP
jgi:hypothetical protein